jgi:hypothetical protein
VVVKNRLWHYLLETLYNPLYGHFDSVPESVWREEKHVTKAKHPPMP